jgi:ribosome biogenesis GTPase
MSTLAFGGATRERSPVCVGDRVRIEAGVIVGRCERRNRLIRPAPNTRDPVLHALVANVDCLVIVTSAREPEFSCGLIDRFLVAASAQKIQQILCINKSDLMKPDEARAWSHYPAAGVRVVETSARDGRGIDRILELVRGKVVVFCGLSGVGKTSLLRRLLKDEAYGRVGAVNLGSGKGRHTTSGAVLLPGPDGASFIDTPGITNFGLIDVTRDQLLDHFPELHAAAAHCAANCAHDEERTCALHAMPRYASYREILSSLV